MHGSDGLDEATTTGPSFVTALENGKIRSFEITPQAAGIPRAELSDLMGGDPAANAAALRAVLAGARTPYRDIGILNAAVALLVAGKVADLKQGAALAAAAIDGGAAAETLAKLVAVSTRAPPGPDAHVFEAVAK